MEKKSITSEAHCLVLPFPAQGHLNPMLQLSKLLKRQGVRITLVTPRSFSKILQNVPSSIATETISDGFDKGGIQEAGNYKTYLDRFFQVGPETFAGVLEKIHESKDHVDCVIYDSCLTWALDVTKRFGIVGASYFTQTMAVNCIYYNVHLGKLKAPMIEHEISLPPLPKFQLKDMPSFFFTDQDDKFLFDLLVAQFSNVNKADWVLCNTFYELDKELVDWLAKILPNFKTVGPNIPSFFLDKSYEDDQDYGLTLFKSEDCIEWLDNKPKGSVIYVSFGSMFNPDDEQMEELASSLRDCPNYFLWVVKDSEQNKLPKNFEKKTEKGLVVTWCSQLKVLAHEAIGCFVTHCGWNSTLETLCLGVPTIAFPYWSDQTTNGKIMVDVWKMGIRVSVHENKVVSRDTINHCIRKIMESEEGKEMKKNVNQWKNLAIKAFGEGGSSHQNILEFTSNLFHSQVKS